MRSLDRDHIPVFKPLEHLLCCNYSPSLKAFAFGQKIQNFELEIMGSLLMRRNNSELNKTETSAPLKLV